MTTLDESKIIIEDDFLPERDFDIVRGYILSDKMAWYWSGNYGGGYPIMEHVFYSEKRGPELYAGTPMVNTTAFRYIDPIIGKLAPAGLVRVRANCSWRTDVNIMRQRDWHNDVSFDCTTAILYLHDSDGCTVFKDGDDQVEVETKANRLVKFPSSYEHAVTPFTTPERRCVVNINYHPSVVHPNRTTIATGTTNPEHW